MFKQDKQKAREVMEREAAKGQGFGPRVQLWDPEDGDNKIRVMPPWTDKGPNKLQCWREVYQHWINKRPYLCPTKTPDATPGQACPICHYVEQLRGTKDPVDQEKAGDLRAKQRFFSSIVDIEDPIYTKDDLVEWKANEYNKDKDCPFELGETKVQMWSYGPMIFNQLLALVSDEGANVLDFAEGYNIIVTKSGKGKQNTEYRVRAEFKPSTFDFKAQKPELEWFPDLDKSGLLQFAENKELIEAVATMKLESGEGEPELGAGGKASPGLPGRSEQRQTQQTQTPPPRQKKEEEVVEEKPPCFGDKGVHSDTDEECIGGKKKDEKTGKVATYEPCPFFAECKKEIFGAPEEPPPRRGRRPVATTEAGADGVANLEQQMRSNLKGS